MRVKRGVLANQIKEDRKRFEDSRSGLTATISLIQMQVNRLAEENVATLSRWQTERAEPAIEHREEIQRLTSHIGFLQPHVSSWEAGPSVQTTTNAIENPSVAQCRQRPRMARTRSSARLFQAVESSTLFRHHRRGRHQARRQGRRTTCPRRIHHRRQFLTRVWHRE